MKFTDSLTHFTGLSVYMQIMDSSSTRFMGLCVNHRSCKFNTCHWFICKSRISWVYGDITDLYLLLNFMIHFPHVLHRFQRKVCQINPKGQPCEGPPLPRPGYAGGGGHFRGAQSQQTLCFSGGFWTKTY